MWTDDSSEDVPRCGFNSSHPKWHGKSSLHMYFCKTRPHLLKEIRATKMYRIHSCLTSDQRGIGKQCRPGSDATESLIKVYTFLWCLIRVYNALNTGIYMKHVNTKYNQTSLLLKMDRSNEFRQKSPLGIFFFCSKNVNNKTGIWEKQSQTL